MLPVTQMSEILSLENPGFRSVFQFQEKDAKEIAKRGNSRDFNQYQVYADTFFIDLDHGYSNASAIRELLIANDCSFDMSESGNKGVHFTIPTEPMLDYDVPYSHQTFLETAFPFLPAEESDVTIYKHSSLIALPGRIHPKTGKPKKTVEKYEGSSVLSIPVTKRQLPAQHFDADMDALELALRYAVKLLSTDQHEGTGRQLRLWSLGTSLMEAGMPYEGIEFILQSVGESIGKSPHDINRLVRAICK